MPKEQIGKGQDAVTGAQRRLERIEKTGARFLIPGLHLAMTLTRIAGDAAKDAEKRNRKNARRAYDDIARMSRHASLTGNERQNVDDKLRELRLALEQLGEVFAY